MPPSSTVHGVRTSWETFIRDQQARIDRLGGVDAIVSRSM